MILRPARPEDAPGICAISNEIIRDTLITFTTEEKTEAQVAADIRARAPAFLVAEARGAVAGFATYGRFRPGPGYARTVEHSIQLAPAFRRGGAGRRLMEALIGVARAEGVHVMIGAISSAAPDSAAFHAAMGFEETGRLREVGRKQGQWLDLILMQKILGPHPDSAAPGA